jgi:3-methyl-2-oxobutanoate hydroxymethyltransferase
MTKVTIQTLMSKKASGEKIVMLAVHDYPFAKIAAAANTMDIMVPHVSAVRRGAPGVILLGDLPFHTYEVTTEDAIRNAGRFMAECGCDAVKLEGGRSRAGVVKALVDASISVVGHIGFTPQEMTMLGGFQAPGQDAARRIVENAIILEDAGACMLTLEAVPSDVAAIIARRCSIRVCGFGSRADVDGQILLLHDVIGMFDTFTAKFSKHYVDLSTQVVQSIAHFVRDVETGAFPAPEHYVAMPKEAGEALRRGYASDLQLDNTKL